VNAAGAGGSSVTGETGSGAGAFTNPNPGAGAPSVPGTPAIVGKGILDCPAVAAPEYTLVPRGATLSTRFQSTCASCHGAGGVGRPGYPALPGKLTLAEYKATVRQGKGISMPPFDAGTITDAEIDADYQALLQGVDVNSAPSVPGRVRPEDWTSEQRQQILTRGLELLRQPDKFGTACANCHSPDAIELAVIGFSDDDILRRGMQHLPADEALDLVDYVHALRGKYAITSPCSKLWRPFQPGGEPLPGATASERELAFAQELEKRNLRISTTPITSLEDARAAAAEIEALSLRTLPIGVTFPRWSEDAFRGPEHRSFNDWMPGAGRVPTDPVAWYALHDAYLADPSIHNLSAIHHTLREATELSHADSHGREVNADFSVAYNAQGWMEDVLFLKHQSVLLGAHFFRLALLGEPGWFERPALPFPELAADYGPFFHQGLINAEPYCYSNEECDREVTARLPEFMKEEFGPDETVKSMQLDTLSDPWSYLGQLQDQSLLTAENFRGPTQDGHYWNLFTFEHRDLQQPFFSAHRLLTQQAYATQYRGTEKYPPALDEAARNNGPGTGNALTALPDGTTPLLHGDWTDVQGVAGTTDFGVDREDPALGPSLFLRTNLALMVLYLQRELLAGGAAVGSKDKLRDNIQGFRGVAELLALALEDEAWAAQNPKLVQNRATLVDALSSLVDEVDALMGAAVEVDAGSGF
jgi:mono/diheme cytochrome c family protein